jgi:LPXTG-site transpeptidase (sortase) family protein
MRFAFVLIAILLLLIRSHAQEVLERLASVQVFTGALDAVAFSPDGTILASGGRDNTIRFWNAETGELLRSSEGHSDWISSVAFSPDGTILVSGSRDDTVRRFDAETGELLSVVGSHDGDVTAVAISPDGLVITSGSRDSQIKLWDGQTGEALGSLEQFSQPIWKLAFHPNGNFLASSSEDGSIWLWGLWGEYSGWLKKLVGHEGSVSSIAFSPDGNYLLSGGLDGTVRLWDIRDLSVDEREAILTMQGHLAPVMGVGFSADLGVAISASLDGTVRLWDLAGSIEAGQELSEIRGNGAPLTYLTLDLSNSRAASVGTDGVLNLWDMSAETIARVIESNRPVSIASNDVPANEGSRAIPNVAESSDVEAVAIPSPAPEIPAIGSISSSPAPTIGRVLTIPRANISSPVTTFYLDGVSWAIDPWEDIVGHLQGTAWLNQRGNVVLGGHSEMPDGTAGVFYGLYNVGIGDEIFLQDGELSRRYVVVNILSVDYRDLSVVYPTSHNRLTLITCDILSYVAEQNIYYERLVIVADEVPIQ